MSDTRIPILASVKSHPRVLERLKEKFDLRLMEIDGPASLSEAERSEIRGAAAAFGGFGAKWMDMLPNLEVIASFGVGYDAVDVGHAARRGIIVTNTPDVLNDEVADTTVALLINTVRRLPQAEQWLRDGRWEKEGPFPLSPLSLAGRHVGIFGLGRIGLEIAKRLEPFKLKISYCTRTPREDVPYKHYASLLDMARDVDTLISIVPKTDATHKVINAEILSALGSNGVFVNAGRGWSVDEDDLAAALKNGTIAAAGLDVFYDEPHVPQALIDVANASLLPHVASASVPTRNGMADLVVDNLIEWFVEGRALTPVPETPQKNG
jgi:lactate dehydrogenase-like 2-hydroxyacid dehydrogenase